MYSVLLLFGFISTALCLPGPLGITEGLPAAQVEEYLDNIAASVKDTFKISTPLKDVDWGIDDIFGIPFKFRIQTKNGQFDKLNDVKRISVVTGVQEISGTAHIKGYLYLDEVTVTYEQFTVNIFGIEVSGKAQAKLHGAVTPVNIQIYKNALTNRKPTASIGELQGILTIHLGTGTNVQKIVDLLLDILFALRNINDIFRWAFFQSIVSPIEKAITAAAINL